MIFFHNGEGQVRKGEGGADLAINNSCRASKPVKAWRFPTLDVTIPRLNIKRCQLLKSKAHMGKTKNNISSTVKPRYEYIQRQSHFKHR